MQHMREARHVLRQAMQSSTEGKFLGDPNALFVPCTHGQHAGNGQGHVQAGSVDGAPLGCSGDSWPSQSTHRWTQKWSVVFDIFKSATLMLRECNILRLYTVAKCSNALAARLIRCLWKMVAMQFVLKPLVIDMKKTYNWDVHERVIDFANRLLIVLGDDFMFMRLLAYGCLPRTEEASWEARVQCACKAWRDVMPVWVELRPDNYHLLARQHALNKEPFQCPMSMPCATSFGIHEILTVFGEGKMLNFMEQQMHACGFGRVNCDPLVQLSAGSMCR
jgi:hypothetical protein